MYGERGYCENFLQYPFSGGKPVEEIVARPIRFGCDVMELVGELKRWNW